jgi:hypothetical protein
MNEWFGGFIKADGGNSIQLRLCSFIGGNSIVHNIDG